MKEMRVRVTTLESTWGNFNNWVLELRDGKQIVIPLSLHHSPGSILDFSKHERDEGQGNDTFREEKCIVSWADECDIVSIVSCSECELWDTEEKIIRGVAMEEPLVCATFGRGQS